MNLYKVSYEGLWLGGKAIVFAENENEAIAQVSEHKGTAKFEDVSAVKLPNKGVVFNDNGDY